MTDTSAQTVSVTIAGETFRASRRTAQHLNWTIGQLAVGHPRAKLVILQPCYNTGVAASAGTHDGDAVLDVRIDGLDWWDAQRFLRECGWAAWYRHTGSWAPEAAWHIHMVSLGYAARVGIYVPGQVTDYYNHAYGLKGQHGSGSDTSWFPPNIAATVYHYQEPTMPEPSPGQVFKTIVLAACTAAFKEGGPVEIPVRRRVQRAAVVTIRALARKFPTP